MTSAGEWLRIESLDLEAQGVAHDREGKVVFVEDALPGEEVQVAVKRRKNNWEQATLTEIHRESSQRVRPGCPHFGLHTGACGGCKMQHLHVGAQVAAKQRVLEDNLLHLARTRPAAATCSAVPAWAIWKIAIPTCRATPKSSQTSLSTDSLTASHGAPSAPMAAAASCPASVRWKSLRPSVSSARTSPSSSSCWSAG